MNFDPNVDWEEAFEYRPGQKVELISQPGSFDIIASYEPMMVPPIWLGTSKQKTTPTLSRVAQNIDKPFT